MGSLGAIAILAYLVPTKVLVFSHLYLFAIGIVSFLYYTGISKQREFIVSLLAFLLLLIQARGYLVGAVVLTTALIILFMPMKKFRLLAGLGAISYSLYLVHVPIGGRVVNIGRRFADTEWQLMLVSITGLLVSVLAAYCFYRIFEKPAQDCSSKLRYYNATLSTSTLPFVPVGQRDTN
jgi:peptidoglycan/LPS O-acetylase OafA/YrhL